MKVWWFKKIRNWQPWLHFHKSREIRRRHDCWVTTFFPSNVCCDLTKLLLSSLRWPLTCWTNTAALIMKTNSSVSQLQHRPSHNDLQFGSENPFSLSKWLFQSRWWCAWKNKDFPITSRENRMLSHQQSREPLNVYSGEERWEEEHNEGLAADLISLSWGSLYKFTLNVF